MDSLSLQSHLSLRSLTSTYPARKPGVAVSEFVKLRKSPSKLRYLSQRYMATANREGLSGIEEGDGVIIVDHGFRRKESNLMLNEFVAMFREKTKYPIVEPAHMELAEPSVRDAFSLCVQQGAHRVIVSPFFLSPGRHWNQDIPSLTAEAAKKHPGISYVITAPLGLHGLLVFVLELENDGSISNILMKLSKNSGLDAELLPLSTLNCLPKLKHPCYHEDFDIWELVIALQTQLSTGGCLVTPHS